MATQRPPYPFTPKSNAYLLPGHFWAMSLRDRRLACGVVVAVPTPQEAPHHAINSRTFVAGLLDWVDVEPPSPGAVAECRLLAWGFGHVKMISETGGPILGRCTQPLDGDGGLAGVSHRAGGTVGLYRNGRLVRAATPDEARDLPVFGTWGFTFIAGLAERVFVDGQPVVH